MARPKRTKAQKEADMVEMAKLYLEGYTQEEMAAQFKVSQVQICKDMRALRDEWIESSLVDIDAAKRRELARIDRVEDAAVSEYARSRQDAKKSVRSEKVGSGEHTDSFVQQTETTEGRIGDPRFLTIIQNCVKQRCAILGLDAPTRNEMSGPNGGAIPIRSETDLSAFTSDELETMAAIQESVAKRQEDTGE
jgi:hypothetical protein